MIFTWKSSTRTEFCLHDIMRQDDAAQNKHFVYAFVDVNVVSGNDVFDVRFCKPMPFCTTRFKVRNAIILKTFQRFLCDFRLESGKMQA